MYQSFVTKIVTHRINGDVDDAPKFVEIDGKKFVPDAADPKKAKVDDKGQPVQYVESPNNPLPLEELAKTHPDLANLLKERNEWTQKEMERVKAEQKKTEEDAAKKGEWQKLFEDGKKRASELETELEDKKKQLEKYAQSTKEILDGVMKTIPEKNRALIPDDYSPRLKLEYITKNSELLGARFAMPSGAPVPSNDKNAPINDETKLLNELTELQKKSKEKGLTVAEQSIFYEKSKALKALRQKKT